MITWRAAALLWSLALLPPVVAFFVWALRRRREALMRFAEARLLPTLTPDLDNRLCRGTLLSRSQYLTDVYEWGYQDARLAPHGRMSAMCTACRMARFPR